MNADTLQVVVIGTGGWGRYHLDLWQKVPRARIAGVFDVNAERAAACARQFGIERVFGSLDEALHADGVAAADICTPNRLHAPAVTAALEAGLHVVCEKPLAVESADIEAMIAARDRSGKLLMTAQHMRFEERSQSLKRLIDAGRLGEVYHARAQWLRRRFAPVTPGFLSKAQAGHGPGMDIGVHVLDLAMHFMGFPKAQSVSGVSLRKIAGRRDHANQWGHFEPRDFEVEDFAAAFVRFEGGAALVLEVSWLLNQTEAESFGVTLFGTEGGAAWPQLTLATQEQGLLVDSKIVSQTGTDGHRNEMVAFTEAIRSGGPSPVPAEQSLAVARVLEGLYLSAETGREVRL